LLVLAAWYGLGWDKKRWWIAGVIIILYAITDEFHQSFMPGRTALWFDVLIDTIGARAGLFI
jgi:VanZ family protein